MAIMGGLDTGTFGSPVNYYHYIPKQSFIVLTYANAVGV